MKRQNPRVGVATPSIKAVALFDGMQQAKMVEKTKDTFCPPATPDLDQLRLVIEKWVTDNPKDNKVSVGWAAPMALSLAFPCN
jgi:hypothetical protein